MLKSLRFLHRLDRDGNISIPGFGSPPGLVAERLTPAGSVPYLAALAVMHKKAWCAAAKGPYGLQCYIGYHNEVPEDQFDLSGHPFPGNMCFSLSMS